MTKLLSPTESLLALLQEHITDLLNQNTSGICEKLTAAPDGKLSVSIGLKLTLINGKAFLKARIGYAEKHQDETEGSAKLIDPDPEQAKLGV